MNRDEAITAIQEKWLSDVNNIPPMWGDWTYDQLIAATMEIARLREALKATNKIKTALRGKGDNNG